MAEPRTAPLAASDGEQPGPYAVHAGRESIDDGVRILKEGESFVVFDRHGDAIPGRSAHGLYHAGTRHLSHLLLLIEGQRPLLLKSTVHPDNLLIAIDLTNPDVHPEVEADSVHVFRSKVLRDGRLHEQLRITNHGLAPIRLVLTWRFAADFTDLFEVRGTLRARRGVRLEPEVRDDGVRLAYRGLDGVIRRTDVTCAPRPTHVSPGELRCEIELAAKEETTLALTIRCDSSPAGVPPHRDPEPLGEVYRDLLRRLEARRARVPRITGATPAFNRWIERSLADVYMMISDTPHGPYPYAGVPWYSTVFGRDGIITALFTLWADPEIARGVLKLLAATQADRHDPSRDAEPGKIIHELRTGEMAELGEVPFGRYYGSVDATPLFVMLAGAYLDRTADLVTVRAIWPNVERALAWLDTNAAGHPHGFTYYAPAPGSPLLQQGWKDSATSVFHADGSLATAPIALCEVQAYAYAAHRAGARIARSLGHVARAATLERDAERLRVAFEAAYWREELGTYALAIDGDGRPCDVRTSNAGHCLWAGIAAPERADRVAALLLSPPMFSGWGVRTLASHEVRYNPMSYHNGSVWPHDSAVCAAGLGRYGRVDGALTILTGLYEASQFMELQRMPELVCGFARKEGQGPTRYPVACSPQAWAAAAPLALLATCLGLSIDGGARRVWIAAPQLPAWLDWLVIEGLHVTGGELDVRFERRRGVMTAEVTRAVGTVTIDTSAGAAAHGQESLHGAGPE